ncbi:formylglycine-generating enzyme family protein [Methylomonas sp. MED-D]|uniref:formylglycine-generating enzyme family protein n=1 Tax=Methylomonas sp. MED-D TaxID=3418768 RepID=UPI003D07A6C7
MAKTLQISSGIDPTWHPLIHGGAPAWASEWGQDRYGVLVAFTLDDVTQRLRWIPPGRFEMGSPESETRDLARKDYERPWFEAEQPRHSVLIGQGYWLFDTPCTQALWTAVMGGNPSRFQSPRRPVEQVSWDEVQVFIQRLNARIPGLDLTLPSEARWEYACRADTDSALYSGPIEIMGLNHAPALDAIAWYGGNSGEGFELADGQDSTGWEDMQYPNPKSGSREVGLKRPNAWGLYDMLGNVWEWVQDDWHPNYNGAPVDGCAWVSGEAGAARVVRGGSWNSVASFCRCACRSSDQPDYRVNFLGFRCARVQA